MWWETNPCLFGLLELEHPFGPGQVVHLLKSLHLSPEGAVGRVIGRVVRGHFVSRACPHRETGLLGYWRWKGLGADRNITADCAAGTGVSRAWSWPDLQEHQGFLNCLYWGSRTLWGRKRRYKGNDRTSDLRGFWNKWWRRAGVPLHLSARRFLWTLLGNRHGPLSRWKKKSDKYNINSFKNTSKL